jgi:AraC family transcriptional regulator of adaptative response/methylated-DNA-[protein]-cysteine methyltransferase
MNRAVEKAELAALTLNDPRYPALVARDKTADGKFYYSVKTTGVYCRPSCAARLARPENVQFHLTCKDAEKAGFRPCKRCKPDHPALAGRSRSEQEISFAVGQCSLGSILVAKSRQGICAILIGDEPDPLIADLQERFPGAKLNRDQSGFEDLVRKVRELIEKPQRGLDLPLDIHGTPFQQRVWKELQQIPVGSTASYTEIATKLGEPQAVRAVARACAANALAVVIPCHRVVRSDGGLSGYRWGVDRKRALLDREAYA